MKKQADEQIIFNEIIPDSEQAFEDFGLQNVDNWLSAGIHPWYINEKLYNLQLKKLASVAKDSNIKFIGECGLDRLKGATLPLQEEIFIKQIRIAEDVKKPVIIHCVKCYNELLSIKKIVHPRIPMIVHGFNAKIEIARQLLDKGFYLSLGGALLHADSNAMKVLQEIPLEKIFLETDDKDISIIDIYQKAAEVRELPMEELEKVVFDNYLGLVG
ncbi:TatD family hydrolase [Emticicia soli]|uniref:TatD family hydrolase n=1 Tax=Emticicia soli TaxID=2027878 RepID=A0ABW5JCR7_9BACT